MFVKLRNWLNVKLSYKLILEYIMISEGGKQLNLAFNSNAKNDYI